MSAELVSLRRVRRRLARVEAGQAAAEARALHGRTRAEREAETAAKRKAQRTLDQARLDQPGTENAAKDRASTS